MRKLTSTNWAIAITLLTLCAQGCTSAPMGDLAGPASGATPGGAQDVGYFRATLRSGQIPDASDITLEGFVSEHDIPNGMSCDQRLCVAATVGQDESIAEGGTATFVQLGFASDVDLTSQTRGPVNLAVVVDVSGSMQGYDRIDYVQRGLQLLLEALGPEDRLALVTYSSDAQILVPSQFVTDSSTFTEAIQSLYASGSTNLHAGMMLGYEQVAAHMDTDESMLDRVMLLSDGQANRGVIDLEEIIAAPSYYTDLGIGLSTIGVGLDFNQDLMRGLAENGGGNFYFIETPNKLETVFRDELDTMLMPLANNLRINISLGEQFRLVDAYGLRWETETDGTMVVHVPTVFASRRGGAVLLRIEPIEGLDGSETVESIVAEIDYSYIPLDDAGDELSPVTAQDVATMPEFDALGHANQSRGLVKTMALWNVVTTFQTAANLANVDGNFGAALELISALANYVDRAADALDDDELRQDRLELVNLFAINLGGYEGEPVYEDACDANSGYCEYDNRYGYDNTHFDDDIYYGCAAVGTQGGPVILCLAVMVAIRRRRQAVNPLLRP